MIEELVKQHRELCTCIEKCADTEPLRSSYMAAARTVLDQMNICLMSGESLDIRVHNTTCLSDMFRVVVDDPEPVCIVKFSSDAKGNYYFNGHKVVVEIVRDWACKVLKNKIKTNEERPIDFYCSFLSEGGKYDLKGNPFFTYVTDVICRRYAFKER